MEDVGEFGVLVDDVVQALEGLRCGVEGGGFGCGGVLR